MSGYDVRVWSLRKRDTPRHRAARSLVQPPLLRLLVPQLLVAGRDFDLVDPAAEVPEAISTPRTMSPEGNGVYLDRWPRTSSSERASARRSGAALRKPRWRGSQRSQAPKRRLRSCGYS
jgi:hypothetical protein